MKVALVHDFLVEYGGAERVLETLHEVWPKAPIFTAFYDWRRMGKVSCRFRNWDIRPSWVQRCWLIKKFHSPLRFLSPLIWESFDFSGFDVVITSSGWYIPRGIVTKPETLHICYCHHPPRHLYGYPTTMRWKKYLPTRIYGYLINHFLRMYDYLTAQRVDYFIANSKETARRIKKFYRREATVIYPPVEIKQFNNLTIKQFRNSYYLCVSRLAYAKRIDLAIKAANRLKIPLKIVGAGKEEKHLRSIAGKTVEFLGQISDEELAKVYLNSRALIFPAEDEDFGIVPVEAMSFGKPVIALRQGGVVETVVEGKTGVFFDKPTVESLVKAIKQFSNLTIKPADCITQAKKFSKDRFKKEIKEFVEEKYAGIT